MQRLKKEKRRRKKKKMKKRNEINNKFIFEFNLKNIIYVRILFLISKNCILGVISFIFDEFIYNIN